MRWTRSRTSNSVFPEELAILLGGEQVGEGPKVGLGGLAKGLEDAVGEFSLLRGQRESRHGSPP